MMKQPLLVFLGLLLLASCRKEEAAVVKAPEENSCKKPETATGKNFEMYEMSEMSVLMEQMYIDNQRLKERILKGEKIGKFPNHFLQIHKAAMTDQGENDAFFRQQAAAFIRAQELIYEDPANARQHYDEGVNACISCHQKKCAGPIPRIRKLYIAQ